MQPNITEIYKEKLAYYGQTEAALEFAAEEYHRRMLAHENPINDLNKIIQHCKGEVMLHANPQTVGYEDIDYYLNSQRYLNHIDEEDLSLEEQTRISKIGTLIKLTCYETSPIGSYTFYGSSVEDVVTQAIKYFKL